MIEIMDCAGVVGDGINDDASGINAAISAKGNISGEFRFSQPPVAYTIKSPILLPSNEVESSFVLSGEGQASKINATGFTGFAFARSAGSGNGAIYNFENLAIIAKTPGIGGVQMKGAIAVAIKGLTVQSCDIGVYIGSDVFCSSIKDCDIRGRSLPSSSGSIGILAACSAVDLAAGGGAPQAVNIYNCNVTDFDHGVRWGAGGSMIGCRLEENNIGAYLGLDADGNDYSSAIFMATCGFEANSVAIYARHIGTSAIIGCGGQGSSSAAGSGIVSQAGLKIKYATDVLFCSINMNGYFSDAAIRFEDGGDQIDCTMIGVKGGINGAGGLPWKMPNNPTGVKFIQSNNPSAASRFAYLPGQALGNSPGPIEGMEYDITDSTTAAWGASAAAGGTNRVRVRYNGVAWTVIAA